jgi:hypothetical protein
LCLFKLQLCVPSALEFHLMSSFASDRCCCCFGVPPDLEKGALLNLQGFATTAVRVLWGHVCTQTTPNTVKSTPH